MPRCTRCAHRCPYPADASLAVGHGAFFFAPSGRGQQQIGVGARRCGGEGFLHDDQLGALQGAAHGGLVGHALGGVGAGNPQGFDFAICRRLKHFHRCFTWLVRHARHTPECCDLGTVRGVGHIAVRADEVGQSTDFAAPHGVGLASQREGASAGFANLPRG